MKIGTKYKVDKYILLSILLFAIISIVTIYSSQTILKEEFQNLAIKQCMWYIIGSLITLIIIRIGNHYILKYAWFLYIFGNLSLIGLFFFGTTINEAKCWYTIPHVGTIQPSEFMKVILIIVIAKMIHSFHETGENPTVKEEFLFLIKIGIVVLIPSLLTFLQPDTGVVLIYLLITIIMLFICGIRYRWFVILFLIFGGMIGSVLAIYFLNTDLFIKIFGTSFFLRVDRLLNWSNKSGYQLTNGITAIGSAGLFGHGFRKTPIYFPEAQTDFIFAVYASNFGLLGSLFLLLLIAFFDIRLVTTAIHSNSNLNKYLISGILGMLLYQQIQNIGMTFGVMPITGITLPFISYGGSSLLSYMIIVGIILNITHENITYAKK